MGERVLLIHDRCLNHRCQFLIIIQSFDDLLRNIKMKKGELLLCLTENWSMGERALLIYDRCLNHRCQFLIFIQSFDDLLRNMKKKKGELPLCLTEH
jgi:hypothetical protein